MAAQATHRFRGTVRSVSRAHHWFRVHTTTNRSVRIYTTGSTRWSGCDWDDMSYGHHVDARAHRSHHHWVASMMHNWDDRDDWGMMR